MKTKLLILLFLLASPFAPMTGSAGPRGQIVSIDNSVFVAMVDSSIEDCVCVQEKENWCWAACVQMMLSYQGVHKSQTAIVEAEYGSPYNWTASGNEIAEVFNGWNGFRAKSFKSKSAQILIDELVGHSPLLVGTGEHAYLLTHIYFNKEYSGKLCPMKVVLFNPKNGKEEVRDWSDFFSSVNTIVSIWR